MKRAIIASLLLFILAGGAFAQLTFSGEAFVGFQLEKEYDNDEVITATHRDKTLPKFNFVATAARENYGVKLDVDFEASHTDPFSLNGIFGWVDFLDGDLHVSVGQISDAKWVTNLDSDVETFFDDVTGFRVEYKTPLEGLNVGAAFRADGILIEGFDLEYFFKTIVLGGSYVTPLFNTVIAYDMGHNAQLLFGFNYTGMDDLTDAGIEFIGRELATFDSEIKDWELTFKEKVGYRVMRPLNVSLLMEQIFYEDADKLSLFFTPAASYRIMPGLTASLSATLYTTNAFDTANLAIKPCLEYTLKGPALIYVEYELGLEEMKRDNHRFGFGIDIKAF